MNAAAFPWLPSVKHDGDFTWPSFIVTPTRLHCIIQLSSHVSGIFFHLLYYNFQSKTFTFIMKHSSVFLYDSSLYVFVIGIYINKLYMWEYCVIKQNWYSNMFYMWRIIWRQSKTIWSLPFSRVSLTLRSSRILRIALHRTAHRDLHWEIKSGCCCWE